MHVRSCVWISYLPLDAAIFLAYPLCTNVFPCNFTLHNFFGTPQTFSDGPPLTCNCRCVKQEEAAFGDTVSPKNFSKQTHHPPQKHKASLYFQEERERSWWRYWKVLLQEREFVRNSTVPNTAVHPHIWVHAFITWFTNSRQDNRVALLIVEELGAWCWRWLQN